MGSGINPVCSPSGAFNVYGGILGINPPDFTPTSAIINTLQSFAVWFTYIQSTLSACTSGPGGGYSDFVSPNLALLGRTPQSATAQFCDGMSAPQAFPPGDSLLTAQLTDTAGNVGPTAQIIVRVATWTPVVTSTPTPATSSTTASPTVTATASPTPT
jgi:hypothetical protein